MSNLLLSDGMGTFKKDCFILQKNTQISIHYNDKYKSLSKQMHSQLPSGHSAWDKSTKTKCLIDLITRSGHISSWPMTFVTSGVWMEKSPGSNHKSSYTADYLHTHTDDFSSIAKPLHILIYSINNR